MDPRQRNIVARSLARGSNLEPDEEAHMKDPKRFRIVHGKEKKVVAVGVSWPAGNATVALDDGAMIQRSDINAVEEMIETGKFVPANAYVEMIDE